MLPRVKAEIVSRIVWKCPECQHDNAIAGRDVKDASVIAELCEAAGVSPDECIGFRSAPGDLWCARCEGHFEADYD